MKHLSLFESIDFKPEIEKYFKPLIDWRLINRIQDYITVYEDKGFEFYIRVDLNPFEYYDDDRTFYLNIWLYMNKEGVSSYGFEDNFNIRYRDMNILIDAYNRNGFMYAIVFYDNFGSGSVAVMRDILSKIEQKADIEILKKTGGNLMFKKK